MLTSCVTARPTSARSNMYKIKRHGPRTESCGTEQTIMITDNVLSPYTTWNDQSDRYELNHWRTTPRRPNWRSSRSIRRSTVSKAADRSSRHKAETPPSSAARSRSLYSVHLRHSCIRAMVLPIGWLCHRHQLVTIQKLLKSFLHEGTGKEEKEKRPQIREKHSIQK